MNKPEQNTIQQRVLKENCGKLFIKLLQLAAMKSKTVEEVARGHIQDLVNSKTSVEEFSTRIGTLLNTNFNKVIFENLKSGLPLLRLALFRREMTIEGVSPPPSLTWGLTVQKPAVAITALPTATATMQVKRQPVATTAKVIYIPPKPKLECMDDDVQIVSPLPAVGFPKPGIETMTAKKLKLEPMDICYEQASLNSKHSSTVVNIENSNEDSNDVLAMCGINMEQELHIAAESATAEAFVCRVCPPEACFLQLPNLKARFRAALTQRGLEDIASGVAELLSSACRERLKEIVEKLVVAAEHRTDTLKNDPHYEVCKNVRGQLKFLEDVDKAEQKRHKEMEREILMRASKLKTKSDNPELARMRAKAKELQRTEMEEMRQRDADMTALYAIGPRKKPKLDCNATAGNVLGSEDGSGSLIGVANTPHQLVNNNRPKRVNLQDVLFFMEQDSQYCRSQLLYEAYLK